MTVFSEKLDTLVQTVEAVLNMELSALSQALRKGLMSPAIAVGSGGSAVAAAYLARCRLTVGGSPTSVQTPLELVIGSTSLASSQVWLFTANGENPDILAAFYAVVARGASSIQIVTSKPGSLLVAAAAGQPTAQVHIVPVWDPKDGFLSTHSLVGAVTALLLASDQATEFPVGDELPKAYGDAAREILNRQQRETTRELLAPCAGRSTLLVLEDPRLSSIGTLVETSLWECAVCSVQRTDFRNFAHGRHVWLHKRAHDTAIIALTGTETIEVWADIATQVPAICAVSSLDHGNCGRLQNALGIIRGLTIVEALGILSGIDPGKPETGTFARPIYDAPSLSVINARLHPSVRQKQAAVIRRDHPDNRDEDLTTRFLGFVERLSSSAIAGVVLDYDGTLVTHTGRFQPPRDELITELRRLLGLGLLLGIATGRGKSAGDDLRPLIPQEHHPDILIGYYNGAYLQPLSVDIKKQKPPVSPRIADVAKWIKDKPGLLLKQEFKNSGPQLTIDLEVVREPESFAREFMQAFGGAGDLRIVQSSHTFDICIAGTCKTAVIQALSNRSKSADAKFLCIGDSGGRAGNDHTLLGTPLGISVDEVCDRVGACWSLFGVEIRGPDALLRLLQALNVDEMGKVRLDVGRVLGKDAIEI
jgi:hydroxymethylpyrimidine pyrophosphatase-like HAD family hydrolase